MLYGRSLPFQVRITLSDVYKRQLFGSVTNGDIADALSAMGYKIDKKKIEPLEQIKTLGPHQVQLKLYPQVQAQVTVEVHDESER